MARDYELAFKSHDGGGFSYVNTLAVHVEVNGPDVSEASAQWVADQCHTWLTTEYRAMLRAAITVDELHVRQILSGSPVEGAHNVNLAGTLTGGANNALPRAACAVLTLRTALATRRGRGRMFIPPPATSSFINGDIWVTGNGYLEAITAFGNKILAGRTASEGLIEYHLSGRVWSRASASTHDITSILVRDRVHWLRSRMTAP